MHFEFNTKATLEFLKWTTTRIGLAILALIGALTQSSGNPGLENFILNVISFGFIIAAFALAVGVILFFVSIRHIPYEWVFKKDGKLKQFLGFSLAVVATLLLAYALVYTSISTFKFAAKELRDKNSAEINELEAVLFEKAQERKSD